MWILSTFKPLISMRSHIGVMYTFEHGLYSQVRICKHNVVGRPRFSQVEYNLKWWEGNSLGGPSVYHMYVYYMFYLSVKGIQRPGRLYDVRLVIILF